MHDLVHDLAEHVSKSRWDSEETETKRGLRSFFVERDQVLFNTLPSFEALRVVKLCGADIKVLPDSVGKMKHLRYLDISNTKIRTLPKSVGKLYNLQTLRMNYLELRACPKELTNLINLRHISYDRVFGGWSPWPSGMGRLTNLQSLPEFQVLKKMGCGIEELGSLKQLKGKLSIYCLECVTDIEKAKKANLVEKCIRDLSLSWSWSSTSRPNCNDEDVLEALQPHPNLEFLKIENFLGDKFPSWMMSKLSLPSNLKEIKFRGCKECKEVPKLGHLPNLRSLYIEMPNLERLGSDFYGYDPHEATTGCQTKALFPALKSLTIQYAGKLIEWSEPQVLLPTVVFQSLEKLNLQGSPQLRSAPSYFPSLQSLSLVKIDSGVPVTSVLSKLTTLTYLHISGVKGLDCLPEGMLRKNKNLARLKIDRCEELTCIAPHGFGCCASLQSLVIVGCNKLRYLSEGLLAPSLEELLISDCPSLESIPFTEGIEYGSLQTLRIKKCSTLTSIPSLQGFSSLRAIKISECSELLSLPSGLNCCTSLGKIKIRSCNKLKFISIDSLPSLVRLDIRTCSSLESIDALHGFICLYEFTIRDCDKLTSLLGSFPILQCLEIRNCPSLETIPCSDNLTTLSSLKIYSCDGLISKLSELASLTSLRRLEVGDFCKELDSFPVIPQLQTLMLSGWPKLKSLHEQIQHFTSLTSLNINSFDEVESLPEWLGSLSSLTVLIIELCHNLKYLPSHQAMQRLTKLRSLYICCDCPLIKRCRKGGPEWPKISHIPDLSLGKYK